MKIKLPALLICAFALSAASTAFSATSLLQKESLEAAAQNGFIAIDVNGNTVTLTGFVQDDESRQLAQEAAQRGGYEVINFLMVQAKSGDGFF